MEPIHYLKALRRHWLVIVSAVLIAGGAAWAVTTVTSPPSTTRATTDLGYAVTISLWNPGAPTVGPGPPFTDAATLADFVTTIPDVAVVAAQKMGFEGSPTQLSKQVQSSVDSFGFLTITGIGKDPQTAATVAESFEQGLVAYLKKLSNTQIDQQQQLIERQVAKLVEQGGDPLIIAKQRAKLAKLELNRTTPIPLTEFQRQTDRVTPEPEAPAEGFAAPESPGIRVLLACLFGLLAGIVLALVLERFDTRIRSARAAEEAFGFTVLAEVPAIPRGRRKGVVTFSHPSSRAADAFRLAQVGTARWNSNREGHPDGNGHAGHRSKSAQTILVTSPEARDGKTTVAANLAVAYAQAGDRVLVVSCDLRRPAIHEAFGVAEQPGLSELVGSTNGNADPGTSLDLAPYLEPCSVVRVAVLPSGVAHGRPAELLGSPTMRLFLERVKKITDVIVLDCAPLVVASDVVPLLPEADGVVLVARAGKTKQELAINASTLLERNGVTVAGVVLNDAREFSIPLAKRRMYRPTRKMRKAAGRNPTPTAAEEPWTLEPAVLEPEVVEEPQLVDEPQVVEEPEVVEEPQVVQEPQRQLRLPDVAPSEGGTGSGASSSRAPGRLQTLQQQLTELRGQLEGMQLDIPDAREPAPNGSLNYQRTETGVVRPDPLSERVAGADPEPGTQVGFG